MHRLKSENKCVQHNEQCHRKELLRSYHLAFSIANWLESWVVYRFPLFYSIPPVPEYKVFLNLTLEKQTQKALLSKEPLNSLRLNEHKK